MYIKLVQNKASRNSTQSEIESPENLELTEDFSKDTRFGHLTLSSGSWEWFRELVQQVLSRSRHKPAASCENQD